MNDISKNGNNEEYEDNTMKDDNDHNMIDESEDEVDDSRIDEENVNAMEDHDDGTEEENRSDMEMIDAVAIVEQPEESNT